MIVSIFLYIITGLLSGIFFLMPVVTLSSIPVLGPYIASTLVFGVRMYNSLIVTFPYASTAFHVLIYVILPFEIIFLTMKLLLGSRMISNHH